MARAPAIEKHLIYRRRFARDAGVSAGIQLAPARDEQREARPLVGRRLLPMKATADRGERMALCS
jgi:hypothetical protein